jgi:hypothetical protein
MLRVTIDLLPDGNPHRARTLETIDIANCSPFEDEVAQYVIDGKWTIYHRRSLGALPLVAKAIMEVVAHRLPIEPSDA